MDFLRDKVSRIYFRYLAAAFGSALITSIYGLVDMAMVGQYQGPEGTAALAVVMPVWNIVYSLGLLMGIGGSVLFSTLRGENDVPKSNEYFTTAVIGASVLAVLVWLGFIFFDTELLVLFGAKGSLLPLAKRYLLPIKFVVPLFLFNQMLAAFLRNDGDPALATKAVLSGGIFNVFGDYFCVFVLGWGIFGAGFATAAGSTVSCLVMLAHFVGRKNTLRLVKPQKLLAQLHEISAIGFSTFFIDIAMGVLTVLFNRQITKYLNTNALSVYGVAANISTFVQCCAYSVGQAAQPILSVNYGAGQEGRIRETLRYALGTTAMFSLFWTLLSLAFPNLYVRLFMSPTEEILQIAPLILRRYSLSFLFLPLNVFSTYYFQALMQAKASFLVSVSRGALLSGCFIFLLPALFNADAIWFAMPAAELLTAIYVVYKMVHDTQKTPEERMVSR